MRVAPELVEGIEIIGEFVFDAALFATGPVRVLDVLCDRLSAWFPL